MLKSDKILVLGSGGLVGSAITRCLAKEGYDNVLTPKRSELNLFVQSDVLQYFEHHRPQHVFLAAAKVGGIMANATYPANFI
ncbi:MAG: NAD-dependent epimerase/dehydratase family protein, partial [Bacteriovoracaceae bacterium]|nr:NAD-dependent epimerase/dehydratase family protein [Bacteriovoracaceae bacterium]